MTNAMRIETQPSHQEAMEDLVTLDLLVSHFEYLDQKILEELLAGGDFLTAARLAFTSKNRIRRFLSNRPGLRVGQRFAPVLEKLRTDSGYHVDEFQGLFADEPDMVQWDEIVFEGGVDGHGFPVEGTPWQ